MADIKTSNTMGKIIGELTEKALKLQVGVKKEKDGKQYTTDVITGNLIVDGYSINVFAQSHFADKENKMYAGIKTIYDTYVDKIEAVQSGKEADTIEVGIRYECNDYAAPTVAPTEIKTGTRISFFKATRVPHDTPHKAELDIEGAVIRSMAPEIRDEEETGRLIVEVATFDYTGKLKPFKFIVENGTEEDGTETLVDDFEETFEAGQTVRLYAELRKTQIGGNKSTKKAAFGKKVDVNSGFTIIEAYIVGGEEPYEEEKAYDLTVVKEAMNQRKEELDALLKKKQEDAKKPKSGGNSGLGGAGNKSGGVGVKKPIAVEEEDSEVSPF